MALPDAAARALAQAAPVDSCGDAAGAAAGRSQAATPD